MRPLTALRHPHPWLLASLAPLLLAQGAYVRRTVERLPEPAGARAGSGGSGPPLRLLIAGDSAAAGVGVSSQHEALSGQLSRRLQDGFRLSWRLEARSGYTTAQAIEHLRQAEAQPFDVAVISLGVNDVTAGVGAGRWVARLRQLSGLLGSRFQVRHVLFSRLPPMHLFPALPPPLRWYLGSRALHFNHELERHVRGSALCEVARPVLTGLSAASDGFHPGADVYAAWAATLAECIRARHGCRAR
ncbi:MAG TPA: SGNH/GDSL hydrolase family protein [Nevskia sp.]|nr:SGNH/GDSL hydrolase family protein [Nevskia sp.]